MLFYTTCAAVKQTAYTDARVKYPTTMCPRYITRPLWMAVPALLLAAFMPLASAQLEFGMAGPEVSHEVALETDAIHGDGPFRGAVRFTLSENWHVNSHEPLEDFLIPTVLRIEDKPGFTFESVAYPEHSLYTFSFSPDQPLAVYGEVFSIGFVIHADASVTPGDYELAGVLRYQACDDTLCAPPRDHAFTVSVMVEEPTVPIKHTAPHWFLDVNWDGAVAVEADAEEKDDVAPPPAPGEGDWRELVEQFQVTGRLDGYTNTRGFLAFLDAAATGEAAAGLDAGRRWWWMLLVVLGGGLLLNLTPCVLPLIPINVAIIGAGARAGSRGRGFALGGAYGFGIASVYGALGLVVVLGMSAAFGALNATVWFNAAIAVLFVLLALAMFDIVEIDFSKYQAKMGIHGNSNGRFLIALGMGAVSALLAGACVAPVVIYTILQAQDLYAQGHVFALALPFGLGVGMALPWPFLGAGLSLLPKPGQWMTRVKQAFGVFILGFALYYGHLAYTLAAPATYLADDNGPWVHSLETGLARALDEERPVLIDFWATWCRNCSVMDRTTLRDDDVLSHLENHVKIKYQAEVLHESPVKEVVEYFQILGLPTFIVLEPKG